MQWGSQELPCSGGSSCGGPPLSFGRQVSLSTEWPVRDLVLDQNWREVPKTGGWWVGGEDIVGALTSCIEDSATRHYGILWNSLRAWINQLCKVGSTPVI